MKKILIIIAIIAFVATAKSQTVVIANKNVSETNVDASTVSDIYSLNVKNWKDGSKIVVVDIKSGSLKDSFYTFIDKDPNSLKKNWLKKKLTSGAKTPESVGSSSEAVSKVASTPGAIGYCNKADVTADVKVLAEL